MTQNSDFDFYPPSYEDELEKTLTEELQTLHARGSIDLRRWFVKRAVLDNTAKEILSRLTPTTELVQMARGQAPSPEHSGIAARLLYEHMNRPDLLLALPSISDPQSWIDPARMTHLILWCFQPWREFRYDPMSETAHIVLANGQWSSCLKGKHSEGVISNKVTEYLQQLEQIGFTPLLSALARQGLISIDPAQHNMEASAFATALQASEHVLRKFLKAKASIKDVSEYLQRHPLMMFDTSTLNCVQGFAALGNGVVPTQDIREQGEGYDVIKHAAGTLLPADPEFCLSNAAGLAWPTNSKFNDLMNFRRTIEEGRTENTWDEWRAAAQLFAQHILSTKCQTYKNFLDHTFPITDSDAPEERDAFLRLLGAAVFGNNLKILAAFIGAPNAGKDTVIKWLSYIMGNGQVGVLSPLALTAHADDQRAFAPLKGAKLAVVSGEVGDGRGSAILAEKLKSITSGGGTLTVAEKYEKPTTIFFDGMLVMQGNSVPTIIGGDKALYRNRLVAVEFKHPFALTADGSYDTLYRKEAPYFLQVLFLHYLDYVERGTGLLGIAPPLAWRTFGEDIELSADPLAMIDKTVSAPNPAIQIPSTTFYKALNILAERSLGIRHPLTTRAWANRLKRAGVSLNRDSSNAWRSKVNRADYQGWVFHFTLDADKSDGFFTQEDWTNALQTASV